YEAQLRGLVESGRVTRISAISEAIEGLARAQAHVNDPRAMTTLLEARTLAEAASVSAGQAWELAVQCGRTELEITVIAEPSDVRAIERVGTQSLQLARD